MKLKILNIDSDRIIRNNVPAADGILHNLIKSAEFRKDTFYAFSYLIESKSDSTGVGSVNGSYEALDEFMKKQKKTLLKCRFILVDTKYKQIFYDGDYNTVKGMMKELFDVKPNQINSIVDLSEFKRLKSFTVKTTVNGQMASGDLSNNYNENFSLINDLEINVGQVESTSYEVKLVKQGATFSQNKFKEIVSDCESGLRRITVNGFDENGAEIKLSSLLSKTLVLFEERDSWNDKLKLDLQEIYEEVNRRIT